ncbi:MAG: hypothetical protein HY301_09410 [Verrucomicrobia bacterium]|nr:hypothetical protein [Verrucomicrobiota bacterium]
MNTLLNFFSQGATSLQTDGSLAMQSSIGRFVVWTIAFLVIAPVSFLLWRKKLLKVYAVSIFFASFVIPLIVLPGFVTEKIRVSPKRIEIRVGFWFSPHVETFDLEGVVSIYEVGVKQEKARLGPTKLYWMLEGRDGTMRRMGLPDLFNANRGEVVRYLTKEGIRFPG